MKIAVVSVASALALSMMPLSASALTKEITDIGNGIRLVATLGNSSVDPVSPQLGPNSTAPNSTVGAAGPFQGSVQGERRSPWKGFGVPALLDDNDDAGSTVARPAADPTDGGEYFAAILDPNNVTSMTYENLTGGIQFLWGSVDTYNKLTFTSSGGVETTFLGDQLGGLFANAPDPVSEIGSPANYQFNAFVTFYGDITKAVFATDVSLAEGALLNFDGGNAFEIANVSNVPLPAAAFLLMGALAGFGVLRRSAQA